MTRVKRGVQKRKRKKKIIKQAKGYKWSRKSKYRAAKEALQHAWTYAYRDRKTKKRDFRRLWQIKINDCFDNNLLKVFYYLARMDYLLFMPAFIFLYYGLTRLLKESHLDVSKPDVSEKGSFPPMARFWAIFATRKSSSVAKVSSWADRRRSALRTLPWREA